MPQIGPLEIAVVVLIALLVFGPTRLPELAKQAGSALRELRRIQGTIRQDLSAMMADESDGAAPPPTLAPKTEVVDSSGEAGDEKADPPPAHPAPPPSPAPPPPAEAD